MTNPDLANVLRNMKVPERLTASQALRAYLLAQTESGHDMPTDEEQQAGELADGAFAPGDCSALGALEERMASAQYRRRRRWF